MITIFSIPKPFAGPIGIIQKNAILSWLELKRKGNLEIILFGNEPGVKETAATFKLKHIPKIQVNEYGTPLISDVFTQAKSFAPHQFLGYVNGDIIFLGNLLTAFKKLPPLPQFLIIGRRIDLDVKEPLKFSDNWEKRLWAETQERGVRHGYSGIDYFIFPKNLPIDLPPFAVGRPGWDNSFIYQMRKKKIPVIDASTVITAIHQNHHYQHHQGGQKGVWQGPEAQKNFQLAGGFGCMLNIMGANLILTPAGLKKPPLKRRLYAQLPFFYPTRKLLSLKRAWQNKSVY